MKFKRGKISLLEKNLLLLKLILNAKHITGDLENQSINFIILIICFLNSLKHFKYENKMWFSVLLIMQCILCKTSTSVSESGTTNFLRQICKKRNFV